jgi:galactokinase
LEGYALVVLDTGKPRELAASAYNERRATCEAAAERFRRWKPEVRALRDVTLEEVRRYGPDLPETMRKRVEHVVGENQRVLAFAQAARQGEVEALGRLMSESHASSRDLYEVSCFELDTMVELALSVEGVIGARMTGAGFGGAAIAWVRQEAVPVLKAHIHREYPARTGLTPRIDVCHTDDGAGEVPLEF